MAYNLLGPEGQAPELLGVVVEVGMWDGLDVLAAYTGYRARYINYSEKYLVWESRNPTADALIDELLEKGRAVVRHIGPWGKPRLPFAVMGRVRLSFLTSEELYFGEGAFQDMAADAMAGTVLMAATQLMKYLTSQAAS